MTTIEQSNIRILEKMHPDLCANIRNAVKAGITKPQVQLTLLHVAKDCPNIRNAIDLYIDHVFA